MNAGMSSAVFSFTSEAGFTLHGANDPVHDSVLLHSIVVQTRILTRMTKCEEKKKNYCIVLNSHSGI